MAIFDPGTCRIDQVSLAGSAIGATRSPRKSTARCDEDLRQVRLVTEGASASDLKSEGVEATLCAGCAQNYEHRVSNCGCSVCGLQMAAGVLSAPGVGMMCPTCSVEHVSRAACGAVAAAVERAAAPLRARVEELEAAASQTVPARLAPPSRFDGRLPATDRNGRELGEGSRGYYLPGMGGEKGTWVPLNPQLAEVVASGLTMMVLIRKPDNAPLSVADYFYFMSQVRGMALDESLGAPALVLYVEGTDLRYAMPLDELAGVVGPPLEAFREISCSGITSNVLAVADGTMVSDQGMAIDPMRLREMAMRAAMARSSSSNPPAHGTPPEGQRPQATPSRDRARELMSLDRKLGAQGDSRREHGEDAGDTHAAQTHQEQARLHRSSSRGGSGVGGDDLRFLLVYANV